MNEVGKSTDGDEGMTELRSGLRSFLVLLEMHLSSVHAVSAHQIGSITDF